MRFACWASRRRRRWRWRASAWRSTNHPATATRRSGRLWSRKRIACVQDHDIFDTDLFFIASVMDSGHAFRQFIRWINFTRVIFSSGRRGKKRIRIPVFLIDILFRVNHIIRLVFFIFLKTHFPIVCRHFWLVDASISKLSPRWVEDGQDQIYSTHASRAVYTSCAFSCISFSFTSSFLANITRTDIRVVIDPFGHLFFF